MTLVPDLADLADPKTLAALRREIPGLDRGVYLNTGTQGPSPHTVTRRLFELYEAWQAGGPGDPEVYIATAKASLAAKEPIGAFLGVTGEELALTGNATDGINIVANGIQWKAGDEVIISDQEHPAGLLIWLHLRQTRGIGIRIARLSFRSPAETVEEVASLITPRTRLVAMSHVTCQTGLRVPAKEITEVAHGQGVPVMFDGAQSVGQFPLDLRSVGCDFYSFNGHKWLLGPAGTGALFVSKEALVELLPDRVGAGSPQAHTSGEDGHLTYGPTAQRFEFGTRCHPLWQAWPEALVFLGRVGLDRIEGRGRELSRRLREGLRAVKGVSLVGPDAAASPEMATALVACRLEGMGGEVFQETLARRFRVLTRPVRELEATRFSCAFFNTEAEIDKAIEAVKTLALETVA